MAAIGIKDLIVEFGDFRAVDRVSLDFADGEFVVLLGPSGCGKTTTLRCIAGLQEATGGDITFDGRSILDRSPSDRNVAMVFQTISLYPHLSVRGNIALPLKARRTPRKEVEDKIRWVAEVLDLGAILNARPGRLPPGAKQRVALARAIVRSPNVLLLDEPLSAVDEQFRENMRWELGHIQKELGVTTIYVTHDQREAMALADRIVLMRDGRIEQFGDADDLYFRPATAFTGYFIGSPSMNFFDVTPDGDGLLLGDGTARLEQAAAAGAGRKALRLGIRPQHVRMGAAPNGARLAGAEVISTFSEGRARLFSFRIGDEVYLGSDQRNGAEAVPQIAFDLEQAFLFDPESGRRVAPAGEREP
ncbi:MAG: ABC transporter ATP-binding protein [Kiloniellales bacterium]|nr:ABC transporter ATP-binding protein [Kiloniellales bacterium]